MITGVSPFSAFWRKSSDDLPVDVELPDERMPTEYSALFG
jgi:hypothetical protein